MAIPNHYFVSLFLPGEGKIVARCPLPLLIWLFLLFWNGRKVLEAGFILVARKYMLSVGEIIAFPNLKS